MSPVSADVLLVTLLVGCLLLVGHLALSLRRARLGRDLHAHADGTVHEHHRGGRPHAHPTVVDRYDGLLDRIFGASTRG